MLREEFYQRSMDRRYLEDIFTHGLHWNVSQHAACIEYDSSIYVEKAIFWEAKLVASRKIEEWANRKRIVARSIFPTCITHIRMFHRWSNHEHIRQLFPAVGTVPGSDRVALCSNNSPRETEREREACTYSRECECRLSARRASNVSRKRNSIETKPERQRERERERGRNKEGKREDWRSARCGAIYISITRLAPSREDSFASAKVFTVALLQRSRDRSASLAQGESPPAKVHLVSPFIFEEKRQENWISRRYIALRSMEREARPRIFR